MSGAWSPPGGRKGPEDRDRGVQRLHAAQRGARARRDRRQRLPAPALSRQPDQDARLPHSPCRLYRRLADRALFKKYTKVAEMPEGAVIGLPNDPSNEGRALRVLQNEGLIKLKEGTGILATTADISENPKKVDIKELDAGIVGRSVEDLDAAVVNTDWALKSGLSRTTASPRSRSQTIPTATSSPSRQAAKTSLGENAGGILSERQGKGRVRQGLQGYRHQRLLI